MEDKFLRNKILAKKQKESILIKDILKIIKEIDDYCEKRNDFRKKLFKFLRQHFAILEKANSYAYSKMSRGYGCDLRDNELANTAKSVIKKRRYCKKCVVKPCCSKIC